MDYIESQLPKDPETLEKMKQDLLSRISVRPTAQTTAEEQIELAKTLIEELGVSGDTGELDVSMLLDTMAILGYVLVEAEGRNYASEAFISLSKN